jgi:hypothetical protein
MLFRFFIALILAAALAGLYFFLALNWSYSTGERAGWVQKLSKKGWLCKTWEGELALVSLPGSSVEKFYFTVHDDAVAQRITKLVGKRVALHYEEKVGLPTTCFGETRHFVTDATEATDIPIGPGISMPSGAAPAPAVVAPGVPVTPPAVPPAVVPPPAPVVQTAPAAVPAAAPTVAPGAAPVPAAPAASQ